MPMPVWGVLLIIVAVVAIILGVLYFFGSKLQKKQLAQQEQLNAAAQPATMFIISKKRMKLKEAGLPKVVLEQAPKRMHNAKMPIVKAKIGPQITSLICDESIFDTLPVKGEVKAMVSGIYIVSVKNLRGKVESPTKKSMSAKLRKKQTDMQKEFAKEEKIREKLKAEKAAEKKAKKK